MRVFPNNKLITCIMPRGHGSEIVDALHADLGVTSANVLNGRGVSERKRYFAEEVDVLVVVVNQSRADAVFEYICDRADVAGSKGRFMFQQRLDAATSFVLPEILPQEGEESR